MTHNETVALTVAAVVIGGALLLYFHGPQETPGNSMAQNYGDQVALEELGATNPGSNYLSYNVPTPATIAAVTQSDIVTAGNQAAGSATISNAPASACGCASYGGSGQANTPFFATVGALANSFTGSLSDIEKTMSNNLLSALPNWTSQSAADVGMSQASIEQFQGV